MDMINLLSDDLLLRILSLVPTKDLMATSLVSKRWQSLWRSVSRIDLDDRNHYNEDADYKSFTEFAYRTLMKNKAPVLDSLHLHLGPKCHAVDVGIWIETAIAHRVRRLTVMMRSGSSISLPSSLYTCETLEDLTLFNCHVSDVPCCLPFLKSLRIEKMGYASLHKLLLGCPNLQFLRMGRVMDEEHEGEDTTIALPFLRHLDLVDVRCKRKGGVYVIEAPHLEYLKIVDDVVYASGRRIENMPYLTEAHVDISKRVNHSFLIALASARRLYLSVSLRSKVPSMIIYFYRLVHLELNTCPTGWWELLTQILQNSPKLASLKLTGEDLIRFPMKEAPDCWKPPSCISDSLETFAWSGYKGRQGDLRMATYIINNAARLKTATISPQAKDVEAKYKMLKDLVSVTTPSISCQLLFD